MTTGASSNESLDTSRDEDSDGEEGSGSGSFAAALARMAEEEGKGSPGEESKGEGSESKTPKPSDLAGIAKALGVKVEDLYAVKVPASAGREAMTIGQIKDRFTEWDSLEAEQLAFSERRVQEESDLEMAREEFRELLTTIPKEHLSAEKLQQVAVKLAARAKADGERVLALIPEWKDAEKRTAELGEITSSLQAYGIPKATLSTVLRNPGLTKFVRDAVKRELMVRKALAGVKRTPAKKAVGSSATARGEAPRKPSQESSRPTLRPSSGREQFTAIMDKHR